MLRERTAAWAIATVLVISASVAHAQTGGEASVRLGVHPQPPRPGDDTGDRDTELILIARESWEQRRPAILAGDLNDVAWSRTSRQLQRTAALRDPRVRRGLFATFSANLPAGFRWPLDHVLVSDDFNLCALERPGDIDSDHFPLLVDLLLQREGPHP